jgi:hypothetical protein
VQFRRAVRAEIKPDTILILTAPSRRRDEFVFQFKPRVVSGKCDGVIFRHLAALKLLHD